MKATTILLREQGIQAFSHEGVARQAGLSRQLIRYYYPGLDKLIADLCDYLANIYRDMLVAGIVKVAQIERLDFFLDFFFGLLEEHPMPRNLEVYDAMVAYAVGAPPLKGRMRAQYETLGQVIVHELAIVHPQLEGRACEELSYLFVSLMHAHWSFVASLGYAREHGRLTRKAIDRLIASYIDDPTPTPGLERPWLPGGPD